MKRKTCSILIGASAAALVGAYILTALLLSLVFPKYAEIWARPRQTEPFEAEAWTSERVDSGTRYRMANDLVARQAMRGLTPEEAQAILGSAHTKARMGDQEVWSYTLAAQAAFPAKTWLAPFGLYNIDDWELVVIFEQERIVNLRITST